MPVLVGLNILVDDLWFICFEMFIKITIFTAFLPFVALLENTSEFSVVDVNIKKVISIFRCNNSLLFPRSNQYLW